MPQLQWQGHIPLWQERSCTNTHIHYCNFFTLPTVQPSTGSVCVGNESSVYGPPGLVSYSWTGPNIFQVPIPAIQIVSTKLQWLRMEPITSYQVMAFVTIQHRPMSQSILLQKSPQVKLPVCTSNSLTLSGEPEAYDELCPDRANVVLQHHSKPDSLYQRYHGNGLDLRDLQQQWNRTRRQLRWVLLTHPASITAFKVAGMAGK